MSRRKTRAELSTELEAAKITLGAAEESAATLREEILLLRQATSEAVARSTQELSNSREVARSTENLLDRERRENGALGRENTELRAAVEAQAHAMGALRASMLQQPNPQQPLSRTLEA